MSEPRILIRFGGEITIKARGTRTRFIRRLVVNIEQALQGAGIEYRIDRTWSRLFVSTEDERAPALLSRIFGVQTVSPSRLVPVTDLEGIVAAGVEAFSGKLEGKTFAVRSRRTGDRKVSGVTSPEVERHLGAALLPFAAGVDLTRPDVTAALEITTAGTYFFEERIQGPAGLPAGIEGRALSLVSGGFDSIVASWEMLKRGVHLDFLFCNLGGSDHLADVVRVLDKLLKDWGYGLEPRLVVVDFERVVQAIQSSSPPRFWQVVLKRMMLRTADRVARRMHCQALVTGEAVGQVSSQTLHNLAVISAVTEMPILRPLIGSNKDEITRRAQRIGTYEASAAVPEYCALVQRRPATRAQRGRLEEIDVAMGSEALERAFELRDVYELAELDLTAISRSELGIGEVPAGATVLDLRPVPLYRSWHYPDALCLDFRQALSVWHEMDREQDYLLYCEIGLKSALLAEKMHDAGFRVHHFEGGVRGLMRLCQAAGAFDLAVASPAVRD